MSDQPDFIGKRLQEKFYTLEQILEIGLNPKSFREDIEILDLNHILDSEDLRLHARSINVRIEKYKDTKLILIPVPIYSAIRALKLVLHLMSRWKVKKRLITNSRKNLMIGSFSRIILSFLLIISSGRTENCTCYCHCDKAHQ